jgi:transposase
MSNQRKKYTQDYKDQAVKMVTDTGLSGCEVAKRLNISESNIRRWLDTKTDKRVEIAQESQELNQLRKAYKRALMELDILKKAAAFFANECTKDTHL